jgi:hypothetical protein
MAVEDRRDLHVAERLGVAEKRMCCIFWCRETAAVVIRLEEKDYFCCRKHAPFVKVGRLDWFDR